MKGTPPPQQIRVKSFSYSHKLHTLIFRGHPNGVDGGVRFGSIEKRAHNDAFLQDGENPANIVNGERLAQICSIYDEGSPRDAVGEGTA